jgi:hypothetical protein
VAPFRHVVACRADSWVRGLVLRFTLWLNLGPSHVCYPLAQESDHERTLALDFVRIHGEELRDPVGQDLLELLSGTGSKRLRSSGLMKRAAERYPFSAEAGVKLATSTTKLRANRTMTDSGILWRGLAPRWLKC